MDERETSQKFFCGDLGSLLRLARMVTLETESKGWTEETYKLE